MRFILLILLFTGVIVGLFYALDPSNGNITDHQTVSPKVKEQLRKLPRP